MQCWCFPAKLYPNPDNDGNQTFNNNNKSECSEINEAVLALLAVFSFDEGRTWKRFNFDVMDALHEQGFISQPKGRSESVFLSPEGLEKGLKIAEQMFGK